MPLAISLCVPTVLSSLLGFNPPTIRPPCLHTCTKLALTAARLCVCVQSELEDQASKPDGPAEDEDEKENKNRSLAQIIYAENRVSQSTVAVYRRWTPDQCWK